MVVHKKVPVFHGHEPLKVIRISVKNSFPLSPIGPNLLYAITVMKPERTTQEGMNECCDLRQPINAGVRI